MKHLVFLVGSYHPHFSAVGTCCYNIAEEMVRQNKVTVVCMKSRHHQSDREDYQGQTIIRVSHRWWDTRMKLDEKIKSSSGIIKKWYTFLLNTVRAKEYLQIVVSRASLKQAWIKAYESALENIDDPIDVIIPMCFPMEAVVAGMEYKQKHPKVKLIPYLFDQFVDRKELHKLGLLRKMKMHRHLSVEEDMIKISDGLLAIHSLQRHFATHFPESTTKFQFVEHPLIKPIRPTNIKDHTISDFDQCNIVYTGALLIGYVTPDYMLSLLSIVRLQIEFTMHLYIGGNCEKTIAKYQEIMPANIVNHGYVDKETALNALTETNILINIAEIKGVQISSKIFEYMSTGKPIVHFYTASEDVNVKILKDYPLCLCLKQDQQLLQENAEKFIRFCRDNKDKTLNFTEIEKVYFYATPKFNAVKMLEIINRGEQHCDMSKDLSYGR